MFRGEHYQRKVLRVRVKVMGPVGNPESTLQIPGLVPTSLVLHLITSMVYKKQFPAKVYTKPVYCTQ